MRIWVGLATVIGLVEIGGSQNRRSVWDGVFTADQATRGQVRYRDLCASCHGEMPEGGEPSPPLAGGAFLPNWNTLNVGHLFDRTRSTMPQNKPGSLNRQATAELLPYILSHNH